MKKEVLYSMKIGDKETDSIKIVERVPGGWNYIYTFNGQIAVVNVPFSAKDKPSVKHEEAVLELKHQRFLGSVKGYFDGKVISSLTDSLKQKWDDCVDKLIRIDGYTYDQIKDAIVFARCDSFWVENFQSILKLRKKNSDGIKYIDVFLSKANNQVKSNVRRYNNGILEASKEEVLAILSGDESLYHYNTNRGIKYVKYEDKIHRVKSVDGRECITVEGKSIFL